MIEMKAKPLNPILSILSYPFNPILSILSKPIQNTLPLLLPMAKVFVANITR
jgi:hypothetical protein